jgi:hypothetical protein
MYVYICYVLLDTMLCNAKNDFFWPFEIHTRTRKSTRPHTYFSPQNGRKGGRVVTPDLGTMNRLDPLQSQQVCVQPIPPTSYYFCKHSACSPPCALCHLMLYVATRFVILSCCVLNELQQVKPSLPPCFSPSQFLAAGNKCLLVLHLPQELRFFFA